MRDTAGMWCPVLFFDVVSKWMCAVVIRIGGAIMSYRYYSSQRPVSPGSFPKPVGNRVLEIVNFDSRKPCYDANCDAWGYIEYEKPLGKELARCYELVKQK